MKETEKIFKADIVLIALGFTGPEKMLSKSFGIDTVRKTVIEIHINTLKFAYSIEIS